VPASARLGDRLRSLSIVVASAPHDDVPWVPEPMHPLMELIRRDPATGFAAASEAMAAFTDPEALLLDDEGSADAATRARPGVADALRAMYAEAGRQGGSASGAGHLLPVDHWAAILRGALAV
jgi:hypothetical protein